MLISHKIGTNYKIKGKKATTKVPLLFLKFRIHKGRYNRKNKRNLQQTKLYDLFRA